MSIKHVFLLKHTGMCFLHFLRLEYVCNFYPQKVTIQVYSLKKGKQGAGREF